MLFYTFGAERGGGIGRAFPECLERKISEVDVNRLTPIEFVSHLQKSFKLLLDIL